MIGSLIVPPFIPATAAQALAAAVATVPLAPSNLADAACFRAHKNGTDQTGVADFTDTLVTFGTEVYDVGGLFASSRWTPPAGRKVRLSAQARITGTIGTGNYCYIAIFKNGAVLAVGVPVVAIALNDHSVSVSCEDAPIGADYYEAFVFVDTVSGTATVNGSTASTSFSGAQI